MVRPLGGRIIISPPLIIDVAQCDAIIAAITGAAQVYLAGAIHA